MQLLLLFLDSQERSHIHIAYNCPILKLIDLGFYLHLVNELCTCVGVGPLVCAFISRCLFPQFGVCLILLVGTVVSRKFKGFSVNLRKCII